jgi:ribosome biogenesis GTPase
MTSATVHTGRIVRTDAKVCHVEVGGRVWVCQPRGILFEAGSAQKNPLAVGDAVSVDLASDPPSIDAVLPRRNWLGRTASSHDPREQVLVANVDQLLAICSMAKPSFSSNRTDRILAACTWHNIPATLVLNKTDLAKPQDIAAVRETYEDIDFGVLETSVPLNLGIDALREKLRDKVSVLYGGSGVGKSSLLNSLQPGLKLKVGKISKYWDQGKHTTAFSQLHQLDFGGWVIDTPGIRAFRLHKATPADLRGMFPEFARVSAKCRFPDCSHNHEPECAVFEAVEAGEMAASRFASYVEMLDEIAPPREADDVVTESSEDDGE